MYTLYHFPFSQHSRRVIALLIQADLPYETQIVDLATDAHRAPEYLKINPNHQVPALADGDFVLTESNAILRYLCRKHRLTDWYPEDATRQALADQWLDWTQCQLGPAVVDIVLNSVFLGPHGDADGIARGKAVLADVTPVLAERLWTCPYLTGSTPTIADLAVGSCIFHLGYADMRPDDAPIRRWYERMLDVDGFRLSEPPALSAAA